MSLIQIYFYIMEIKRLLTKSLRGFYYLYMTLYKIGIKTTYFN